MLNNKPINRLNIFASSTYSAQLWECLNGSRRVVPCEGRDLLVFFHREIPCRIQIASNLKKESEIIYYIVPTLKEKIKQSAFWKLIKNNYEFEKNPILLSNYLKNYIYFQVFLLKKKCLKSYFLVVPMRSLYQYYSSTLYLLSKYPISSIKIHMFYGYLFLEISHLCSTINL